MARYNVYPGKFKCHNCGIEVTSIRSYVEQKRLTWMCSNKHLSEVNLNTKKTKRD